MTEVRVGIEREADIVRARQEGRQLAAALGFSAADQTLIATAISEVARNIVMWAQRGEVVVRDTRDGARVGIEVIATDRGPGIENSELALRDNDLGAGLPGVRRLMDAFAMDTAAGQGTTVTMTKWRRDS
jgi:serine/threonine-protein kinase RsbT